MRPRGLAALFSTYILTACAWSPAGPEGFGGPEPWITDMKHLVIYDSLSLREPLELRERAYLDYSPQWRSGDISEVGDYDRPLAGATSVYRIGTEKHMATFPFPNDVSNNGQEELYEILTLHLDEDGQIYHVGYNMTRKTTGPGRLEIRFDSLLDHPGSEIILKSKAAKAASHAAQVQDANVEEEEDVPEKTFIQKYWIYVLPFVLLMVFSAGGEQQ